MTSMQIGSQKAASPEVRGEARSRAKQAFARAREEQGQSLVEFALLLPLLMLILLGIISFGIAFNNQTALTNAVNNAAQVVMAGPGAITDPCQSANNALALGGANLNNSRIYGTHPLSYTISAYTNATTPNTTSSYTVVFPSTTGAVCASEAADLTPGQEVAVTATYGCQLSFFGHNFAPSGCVLTAQSAEAVQ
jgi:Flp pilus assembly protein TadG